MENIKSLDSPDIKSAIEKFSPFLIEARKRLLFTLTVFVLTTFVGFFFYESIIKFLIDILGLRGINVVFTSPFQYINLAISCGLTTGLVLSLPLLVAQIIFFLKPALRQQEYKLLIGFLPFSFLLFMAGFMFGALMMKWQIEIFLAKSIAIGIGNILDISSLLSTVLLTSIIMGIGFQLPIILLVLLRIGLLKREQLTGKRKWVYLGSFIFALFLPQDSIIADILLALPLVILFELALVLDFVFNIEITKKS